VALGDEVIDISCIRYAQDYRDYLATCAGHSSPQPTGSWEVTWLL